MKQTLAVAPHTVSADAVATLLEVRPETGLSGPESLERPSRVGPNRLPQVPARSPWRVLLAQFKSILILILLAAAVLAALVGSTKDALVILAVVVINALVGFYQEYRAERSLAALEVDAAQQGSCAARRRESGYCCRRRGARRRLAARGG